LTGVVNPNSISVGDTALHEIKAGASLLALLMSVCSRSGSLEHDPAEYRSTGNKIFHTINDVFILPPLRVALLLNTA
jgi:hypothetical protein